MSKLKKSSHVWKQLESVISGNPIRTVLLFICMAASVLLALLPPQILRRVIDENLVPRKADGLFFLALMYLTASVLGAASEFGKGWLLTVLGEKYIHKVRSDLMDKLSKVSPFHFSRTSDGETTGRFVNDVENVGSLVSDGVASLVTDLLKIAGIIVTIFLYSWKMGIAVAVLVPCIFLLTRLFQRLTQKAQKKNLDQMGDMNAVLTDSVLMAQTVKLYHREEWMQERYHKKLEDNYRTNASIYFYDASYSPLVQIIRAAVITLIIVMASGKVGWVMISAGVAAASIDLITRLFDPVNSLGMEFQNIQKGVSGIKRIDEFLDLPEDKAGTRRLSKAEMRGDVKFDHVSFSYEGGPEIIHDFDLYLTRGDRVTITGRTGAGKTTLVGLLTGMLKPSSGRVTIGGVDIRDVDNDQKRQIFGYVQQDFAAIPGSILDQVTMKDPGITGDMALEAIGTCGLIDELLALENGLDTDIEKAGLSQGQKMLLQIARAIAPDPQILIFDESTASLDSITEQRLDEALSKAEKDRIVVVISHRKTEDRKDGRVVRLQDHR